MASASVRATGERDGLEHAAGLGLASDSIDVRGEDETHTDTGADGGEAVAEEGDVTSHCVFRWRRGSRRRCVLQVVVQPDESGSQWCSLTASEM